MNDWTTRSIVSNVFRVIGFENIAKHIDNDIDDINIYINYINHIKKTNKISKDLKEFINYFL
ncbi:MAG TPA: hypothetical protein VNF93_02505 [Buchnera sp. (in: enterobacteria)]|nr:hypothetical protein [Buchnera sp. (in: enterobacteria)]